MVVLKLSSRGEGLRCFIFSKRGRGGTSSAPSMEVFSIVRWNRILRSGGPGWWAWRCAGTTGAGMLTGCGDGRGAG